MSIKRAELLARFVHHGQTRRNGEPYINHCERMVEAIVRSWKEECDLVNRDNTPFTKQQEAIVCATWLHDAIKDADYQDIIRDIIFDYFTLNVDMLLDRLTYYTKGTCKETYNEYINRLSKVPEAVQIKLFDIIDNTTDDIPIKQKQKYRSACKLLQSKGIKIPPILIERLSL